ncbi:MAG: DNA primase, partial [Rhodanobacteraceae bacterium]
MAGRIPDSFIDDLLARVDIVDVVQERVPLKKSGRDFSARCPFHDERSPSFTVSPTKQFYHCFGCGAHGSAIKFLMEYDRLEFPDAVEELAARVGVKVPHEGGGRQVPREDATDLYALLDSATTFYRRELETSKQAGAYLAGRGLDEATLARFNVGYAPDRWDALKNALGTSPQRIALLEKAGMLTSGDRGSRYDRFRNRVMFPIHDRRGRTIAFGGRIMPSGEGNDGPKYLNSPETPLFHKGRELFGLAEVRATHAKIPRLIVVEGYMDAIALHQFGATQAVATLGTATTRDHAEILFRQCADVYFCFDGDRAGRQAAWRAVESVLPRMRDGRQAYFVFLPEGEDPDSVIRKEELDGFEQRLADAMPLSTFFFAEIGKDVNLASLDGRARLAERARPLLAEVPDGAFRDLMLAELDRRSGMSVQLARPPGGTARTHGSTPRRSLVRTAVALLVQNPGLAVALQPPWRFAALRQAGVPLLIELIEFCRARPDISTAGLIERYADREEASAFAKLAVIEFPGGEDEARMEFVDAIAQLDRQSVQQRLDDLLKQKTESSLDNEETAELRELLASKGRAPRG